ncbi:MULTISPECIES: AraC family transcriptional regulator [Micromonospora]|uniref:AraC family transcriptional regulator n=1 Tax=Micromonospora solifontis TaxID=2487138 RepID=A0ABX9WC78_9ACTN|nr:MULTISPECIES: AraC family transcriptional regulator [Micromonospora]NES16300.1 AraC family transcriptional regulator [Micromonospora sp. PPF5-17B]NES38360.1 AraC family transcriptional regulator [Micromonospora solifontis]NES58112.1 AraC family transcriptional regulator [Micromonospora sp. PPF5-6]RNL95890.1 AraC family transcriptional regulator [Micromonospora solifontis]
MARQWRYGTVGDVEIARTIGTGPLSIRPHFHETVQVTIVTSGTRAFRTRAGVVRAHAGHAIVIPANLPHAAFPLAGEDDSVNVYLPPGALAGLPGGRPIKVATPAGAERFPPHRLASDLRALLAAAPVSRREPAPTALAAAVMDTSADLPTLAARFAVSREAVIRRFTRETGLTPHAFRVIARLNVARRLLRAGVAPAEAAARAGFADQSHLGRRFRAAFGTTPGRYRGQTYGPEDVTFVPDSRG